MSQLEQMQKGNKIRIVIIIIKIKNKTRKLLEIFHAVMFSFNEGRLNLQPAEKQRVGFVPLTNNGSVTANTGCNM